MLTGSLWKTVAITEAVLILGAIGFGSGLIIRPHLSDLAKARGSPQAAHPTGGVKGTALPGTGGASTSPSASATASAQPNQVMTVALREAEARTGLGYAGGGCASGQKCFSAARETDGDGAAYIQLATQGYGAARLCYLYLAQQGSAWTVVSMACGSGPGFAPAVDSTVTIRAPASCGRLRARAGLQGAVVRCLANGSSAQVTAPPSYADGQLWWQATASGATGILAHDLIVDPAAIVPPKP